MKLIIVSINTSAFIVILKAKFNYQLNFTGGHPYQFLANKLRSKYLSMKYEFTLH